MEDPQVIAAELQRQIEAQRSQTYDGLPLDEEIARLRRQLRDYELQKKRLVKLFRYEGIGEDSVSDELNRLKKDRQADRERLACHCRTNEELAKLTKAEIRLNDLCTRVRENIAHCTIGDKRPAMDALDIKVVSTPEEIEITGAVPIEFTTGQTWACLFSETYSFPIQDKTFKLHYIIREVRT